ncbi:MAG: ribonuclease H family protein [Candidatus Kapaibacteriota bacterium]|jgi:ribonuclease HI
MAEIYTDGTSLGNPGKGGFAVIIIEKTEIILAKGFRKTTNNRMELLAVAEALNFIKNNNIMEATINSDSQLVVKAITDGWLNRWVKNGWRTTNRSPVLNIDLWQKIHYLLNFVNVKFQWIEGHSGNCYNELADKIAKKNAKDFAIEIDYQYEIDFQQKLIE